MQIHDKEYMKAGRQCEDHLLGFQPICVACAPSAFTSWLPAFLREILEFVTITGFIAERSLSPATVVAMVLPFEYNLTVNLANDSDTCDGF